MKHFIVFLILCGSSQLFAAPVQKDMCKVLISKLASEYSGECSGTIYPLITLSVDGSILNFKVEGAPLVQFLMSPTLEEASLMKNYGIACDRYGMTVTYNRMSDGMPVLQKLQVLESGSLSLINSLDSDSVSCTLTPSK